MPRALAQKEARLRQLALGANCLVRVLCRQFSLCVTPCQDRCLPRPKGEKKKQSRRPGELLIRCRPRAASSDRPRFLTRCWGAPGRQSFIVVPRWSLSGGGSQPRKQRSRLVLVQNTNLNLSPALSPLPFQGSGSQPCCRPGAGPCCCSSTTLPKTPLGVRRGRSRGWRSPPRRG